MFWTENNFLENLSDVYFFKELHWQTFTNIPQLFVKSLTNVSDSSNILNIVIKIILSGPDM